MMIWKVTKETKYEVLNYTFNNQHVVLNNYLIQAAGDQTQSSFTNLIRLML